jgi:hypothetical protein
LRLIWIKQPTSVLRSNRVCFYLSKHCTENLEVGNLVNVNALPVSVPSAPNKVLSQRPEAPRELYPLGRKLAPWDRVTR